MEFVIWRRRAKAEGCNKTSKWKCY